ncbi:hypothetical protein AAFF_G00112080 [Aldrovandia affinis]|uniref:Uncharacterized protein n=1 Tax=Aldrovandia affinis TaxID=143900 RepID=A0AAD7R1K1_9TELE|nr:hypothetical protein AAFF_G00112080 [Aldrovandia affinis]
MEEIRKSLNFMSEELSKVARQQTTLLELTNEVKQLKNLKKEKDKKTDSIERRIDDLEQYSRMEDTKHRTYARSAAGGRQDEDAPTAEQQSREWQVINFLESKNINIESNSIAACHALPRRDSKTKPAIIVRFVNLTKKNADIARHARNLRKQNKIRATWTRNCKVMIRRNGSPGEATVIT